MSGSIEETGPQYSMTALGREHRPPAARPYDEYRDCLREEHFFTCAYCLSTEREVAPGLRYGGFEIDHFRPSGIRRFRRFRNVYSNLVWACRACNQAKGDEWPTAEEESLGFRFVDPVKEPVGSYLTIQGERVVAVGGKPAARFTIDMLRLNSELHLRRRRDRAAMVTEMALLESLVQTLSARVGAGASSAEVDDIANQSQKALDQLKAIRNRLDRAARPPDANALCVCDAGWRSEPS